MENRILVLAPHGRDGAVAVDLLRRHDFATLVCDDLDALVAALGEGAGVVLLTEEALAAGDRTGLTAWISGQPRWSDLPFVMLANGDRAPRSPGASARMDDLGNVVLLERPLHAEAMIGTVRSALNARRRQYEIRSSAEQLEQAVVDRTRELESARESLAIALDAAGMGSWDIDMASGTARRSLRHDEIFGYAKPLAEWTVEHFLAHVDQSARTTVAAAFEAALISGTLDIECPIVGGDGQLRWIAARGRVTYDAVATPLRMAGVVSDTTARRDAAMQLAQAQKMDAIGQLTGGVAHDFNNLLTPIVGSLDMIRRRYAGDERTERIVGGAIQAAERAATLTQRLLAFARRQALQPVAVDIGRLIDGLIELMQRTLGPTIEVTTDVPDGLPAARVDPNQLELALLNLAINARDAMPAGGRLRVTAAVARPGAESPAKLPPGDYIRLRTEDNGAGMDEATLMRAIEPFFSTKGVGKGTGLGLSMVHGLAAQSGGGLALRSMPGRGTVIELWLPVTADVADTGGDRTGDLPRAHRSATVLVVDDEALVRAATSDMLRDMGYVVIEAASAQEALQMLGSNPAIELLVTDYLMPGMTGAALIAGVRRQGWGGPILLVTGYTAAEGDLPADVPRLEKPFRQSDLASRVDELLANRPPGHRRIRAID